jgi:hemerythrin superfamily protein
MNPYPSAAAKGAAKQAITALKGQTGIFSTLAKEHGEVSSLLKKAAKASDENECRKLLDLIRVELLSHAKAEEETFYAALLNHPATAELARTSEQEHRVVETLLESAQNLAGRGDAGREAIENLAKQVESHAQDEEQRVFPLADEVFSRDEQQRMDEHFKNRKDTHKMNLQGS